MTLGWQKVETLLECEKKQKQQKRTEKLDNILTKDAMTSFQIIESLKFHLCFFCFVWIPKEFSYSIVTWPAANVNKTSGIQGLGNFTKAMSACRRGGRPSELLALMEEMPKMTVMPNEIRYLM